MSIPTSEIVNVGRYRFKITKNIMKHGDRIINHTYKIGGDLRGRATKEYLSTFGEEDYQDCIGVSYNYSNNIPVSVSLPYLLYEPECSLGSDLQKGIGTELIIKTAIRYAYNDVPTIPIFTFDDMSHIDCIVKDLTMSPPRKLSKKVNLSFFSIAYNGMTWYEARFNAKMTNEKSYDDYKKSLEFLKDPKAKVPFERFLEISHPSLEQIAIIEPIYARTTTYRQMFEEIPDHTRCDTLYLWLSSFMKHYIGHTFSEKGWEIDVNNMEPRKQSRQRGGVSSTRAKAQASSTRAKAPVSSTRKQRSKVLYRIYNFKETHDF